MSSDEYLASKKLPSDGDISMSADAESSKGLAESSDVEEPAEQTESAEPEPSAAPETLAEPEVSVSGQPDGGVGPEAAAPSAEEDLSATDPDGVASSLGESQGPEDRRSFERFPLQARAQIEFEERRYFLNENVLMASGNGMFLSSDQEAHEGERITFDLRLTSEGPVATGTGEVAWVQGEADTPIAGGPGFGVRFLQVDARGGQLLIDLSEAWSEGGQEALDARLAGAVEDWLEGDDTGPVQPIVDTESILQETKELSPGQQDDIDTDPLMVVESLGDESNATSEEAWRPLEDTDEILPEDSERGGAAGPTLEDRDVLSKTLDVGGSRSVEAIRQRSTQRTPVPIWPVLLTAGLLVGGLLWLTAPGAEAPSAGEELAVAAVPGSDPLASLPSVDVTMAGEDSDSALSEGSNEGSDQTTADRPEFRGIRDITWRWERNGILIMIELDGHLPTNGFEHYRPGTDPPREVVQFFDVADKYLVPELEVGGPEVDRIRVGHHLSDGGAEDRVVLDLSSSRVKLRSIQPQSEALHLFLQVEASDQANGPNP